MAPSPRPDGREDPTGTPSMNLTDPRDQEPLLGRYRVMELRDRGGFGSVLVCWDIRLQRRVAIKCLPLHGGGDTSTVEEGLREARASSFLTHPNIVTVHDFEVDDQFAYLVMEYVDGLTLAELMARVEGGVLIYDEVAHILSSVADALDHAHGMGVLHLDIKPANVMVSLDGTVKLADFGMASLSSAAGWNEARGGTVGYMPPEQLTGRMVDERSDVFSLGCVAYQALTGQTPFMADTPERSLKLIERGAEPLDTLEPELAGPVTEAFARAMDPDPSQRMASPGELAGEVVGSLGDPEAGRRSIVSLLGQDEAEEDFDEDEWRSLDPPGRRIPWLAGAASRLANGLVVAAVAWASGPAIGLGEPIPHLVLAAVTGLLSAAWAPVGSMAAIVLMVLMDLAQGAYTPYLAVALLVAAVGSTWWGLLGRNEPHGPLGLLGGAALGSPAVGAALAAGCLGPVAALVAGAAGSVMGELMATLTGALAQQGAPAPWGPMGACLASPATWFVALGSAAGAWVGSLLSHRGSRALAVAGQVCCLALVLLGAAAGPSLENAGIWSGPPEGIILHAVGSTLFMLMVIATFGPPEPRRWRE